MSAHVVPTECFCHQLGPLSLRSGDICSACERRLSALDSGEAHYADASRRCRRCGSADLDPHTMGSCILRFSCKTCGTDPA